MTYTHEDYRRDTKAMLARYGGDRSKLDAIRKKLNAVVIPWSDVMAYATVYPEHQERALAEIDKRLGYKPHENIIIPHEVFIRTLIEQHDKGMILAADYERDISAHVKHIRNDDINKFGFADKLRFTQAEVEHYANYLPQHAEMVHQKIIRYFGSLPPLDYILPADKMLRRIYHEHPDIACYGFLPVDYKAFHIISYRKALAEQGRQAADQLPLITV